MDTSANRKFSESVMNTNYLLDESINWISCNLEPEDVFDNSLLEAWAEENGYIKGSE